MGNKFACDLEKGEMLKQKYETTPTHTQRKNIKDQWGVKQTKVNNLQEKEGSDHHINQEPIEIDSNCKHEWVQVSLSTPPTRPYAIYVLWRKQHAGNIHVCKNKINE